MKEQTLGKYFGPRTLNIGLRVVQVFLKLKVGDFGNIEGAFDHICDFEQISLNSLTHE